MPVKSATSNLNAPAVITLDADASHRHVIDMISWSYSGIPLGALTVTDNQVQVMNLDIGVIGMDSILFSNGFQSTGAGQAMVITLGGGGLAVIGKLTVEWHDENY